MTSTEQKLKLELQEAYTAYCELEEEQGENALTFSAWLERFYIPENE